MFFLEQLESSGKHVGSSKARVDSSEIFSQLGMKSIKVGGPSLSQRVIRLSRILLLLATSRRSRIFSHYPCYSGMGRIAQRLLAWRHQMIFLIHDIDQARSVSPTQPLSDLAIADACIITGILDKLIHDKIQDTSKVHLLCWDYILSRLPEKRIWDNRGRVVYAGSLSIEKCPWVYDTNRTVGLILAGAGADMDKIMAIDQYIGPFEPGVPLIGVDANWGLVWDGISADGLQGPTGQYQRYNQPHKFSCYIANHLPVICHHDAAVANLVRDWGVGISVGAVDEIPKKIAGLSANELAAIRANVDVLQKKVTSGFFLKSAIEAVVRRNNQPQPESDLIIKQSLEHL